MSLGKLVYSNRSELDILDLQTGERTHFAGVPLMTAPAWHPGGEYIAFGRTHLSLLHVPSGTIRALTAEDSGDTDAAWHPSGTSLVCTRLKGETGLYWLDVEQSIETRLPLEARRLFHPQWSPDGKTIAFAMDVDGYSQIYTVGVPSPDAQLDVPRQLSDSVGDSYSPTWSRDGSRIAFASKRSGQWAIYLMDASGANVRRLTSNPSGDINPTWSPDGQGIIFERWNEQMKQNLFFMRLDGTDAEPVTTDGGVEPDWWGGDY